ncbi:DUF3131 domain-containing protein [Nonomuraea sp. NPDC048916]|uniref:DUF3131 domain-containing protein n=1 Tax=Nonomuraea sp. NPDC048916 TaxID=3154232 RepID=UPI00340E407C
MRKTLLSGVLVLVVGVPGAAHASAAPAGDDTLRQYAKDTWRSMAAMVDPGTGLPADKVTGDLKTRAQVTSPTNIGTYVWSTLTARDLGVIKPADASARIGRVLDALERLERHGPTGQYYNWYDPATLQLVRTWPDNGDPVRPFASSVDNGWLASALMMVRGAGTARGPGGWPRP